MGIDANPVRGTRDYLPEEMRIRDRVQEIILNTYRQYGFERIGTPVMEDIKNLTGSEGGENLSLIFKILKRGQKLDLSTANLSENDLVDSGLRYDLTVPLARYFANNRNALIYPFKCIQIDRVFRAERPQKGRFREFYQCDIDIVGDESSLAEQELIYVTAQALLNIGFEDFTVRVNDRRILNDIIKCAGFKEEDIPLVCIVFDKMDKIGIKGVGEELRERGFDEGLVQKFLKMISSDEILDIEKVREFCSSEDVVSRVQNVIRNLTLLSEGKFSVVYDKSLVRGMGYYTGMVFEVSSKDFSSSIGGGGRYDKMIGKFLNEDVPAVGFSIGFERICEIIKDKGMFKGEDVKKLVLIFNGDLLLPDTVKKLEELKKQGFIVSARKKAVKFGKQLDAMAAAGFNYVMVMGEDEAPRVLVKK